MCWLKYLNPNARKNDYVNRILYTKPEKYEMEIYKKEYKMKIYFEKEMRLR